MTELMKQREDEKQIKSDGSTVKVTVPAFLLTLYNAKAEAYDRLMSGGKKTLNELANILGKPVAIDAENRLWWFPKKPEIGLTTWIWYDNQFGCFGEELPDGLINFTGDWKDSLTLPDGWEFPLTHECQLSRME